jgi:tryptophanyl-tRNA synthetase
LDGNKKMSASASEKTVNLNFDVNCNSCHVTDIRADVE